MRGLHMASGSWRIAAAASSAVILAAVLTSLHGSSSPDVLLTGKEMRRDLRAEEGMKNFWKNLDARDARTRAMVHNLQHERFEHGVGTQYQSARAAQVWDHLDQRPAHDMRTAYEVSTRRTSHPSPSHITYNSRGSRAAVKQFYDGLEDHHAQKRAALAHERKVDEEKLNDLRHRVDQENVVDNAQVASFWQKQAKQDLEEGMQEQKQEQGTDGQKGGKHNPGWFGSDSGGWDIDLGRLDLKSKGAKAQQLAQSPQHAPAATVGRAVRQQESALGSPRFNADGDRIHPHSSLGAAGGDPSKLSRLGVKVTNTLNDVGYDQHPDAGKAAVERAATATPLVAVAKHLFFSGEQDKAQTSDLQAVRRERGPGGYTGRQQRRAERAFYSERAAADKRAHADNSLRDRSGRGAEVRPTSAVEEAADRSDWRDTQRVDRFFDRISSRDAARARQLRAERAARGQRGLRYLEAKTKGMKREHLLVDKAGTDSGRRMAHSVKFASDSLGIAKPRAHQAVRPKAVKLATTPETEAEGPAAEAKGATEEDAEAARLKHLADISSMPVQQRAQRVLAANDGKGDAGQRRDFWAWLADIIP